MKKSILILMLIALMSSYVNIQKAENPSLKYKAIDKTSAMVIGYKGGKPLGEVTIPEKVEIKGTTYNVTNLKSLLFKDCKSLTKVIMPSITTIGKKAFLNCGALTQVELSNVRSIKKKAFRNCKDLIKLELPNINVIGKKHLLTA